VANVPAIRTRQPFYTLVSLVLVTAVLYWAQRVLIPVALAILLAFILTPAVAALQRRGLGRLVSVLVVTAFVFVVLGVAGWVLSRQLSALASPDHLEVYKRQITAKIEALRQGSESGVWASIQDFVHGVTKPVAGEPEKHNGGAGQPPAEPGRTPEKPLYVTTATSGWSRVLVVAGPAGEGLASALLVVVFTVFMLVQRENLRNRIVRLVGHGRLALTTRAIDEGAARVSRFLIMQVVVNLICGLMLSAGLFALGLCVPGPGGLALRTTAVLWGCLVAAVRFVPYLGTWAAAALLVAFSLAALPGWPLPLAVLAYFVILELLTANVLEPLLFGHSTGSSPLALLMAAAFWTWLWGPVGLVLSTPLTVILVVLGKYVPALEFFVVLLGDEPPLSPGVTFYQRLVARDQDEASDLADDYLEAHGFDMLCADIFLATVLHARRDRDRGDLDADTLDYIYEATRETLEEVSPEGPPDVPGRQQPLLIACPARDRGEELALRVLAAAVRARGYRADVLSAGMLASEVREHLSEQCSALVCIGSLPPGGLAQTRYLCKRVKARCPASKVLVARWGGSDDPERAPKRLQASGADFVATTLADCLAKAVPLVQVAAVASAPAAETVTVGNHG
jgi:predicted PurR-regulated permease PerM